MADDRVLKFLYDADLRHVESSAMSPEIQEWSQKSRSRIKNLYLLTRPMRLLTTFNNSESTRLSSYVWFNLPSDNESNTIHVI